MIPSVKEPLAGLALLVILGFLIWYNRPIENSPLFDPYLQEQTPRFTGKNSYEAWLWRDPFGFDPAGPGGAANAWALAAQGKKPDTNSANLVPCQVALENILELGKKEYEGKPIILAPLVKVTPNTVENKEMRTRQRYAVVAGLIESGYRPQEPGLLHFCSIQKDRLEYDMRWEHYRYESKDKSKGGKPDIVVAWIDSKIFTTENKFPAGHLCTDSCNFAVKNLLKELSKDNKFYLFDLSNILGDERSDQIEDHIECIKGQNARTKGKKEQTKCSNDGNIELIKLAGMEGKEKRVKCSDAASTGPLEQAGKNGGVTSEESASKSIERIEQCGNKKANKMTGSEKLAGLLAQELTLRGIKRWSEVMIISEQNSENAATLTSDIRKSLGELFAKQKCAKQECDNQKSDNDSGATSRPDEIKNVFYLKSLDGNPKKTGNQDKRDKNKKDKNETQPTDEVEQVPSIDLHHSSPLPLGSSQLDYFHRLAEEIKNVHNTVDFDNRDRGVKATVILGSDFNDKLLIIEALREKMPHLLILTTDLDAQMLHRKNWRSTRNLVVASHFDLLLREKTKEDENEPDERPFCQRAYQDQFPPFRDSQQTNIFYRTLSIAAGDASGIKESKITFPRIFEVGRNGFVRLGTAEKNNNLDYHPPNNTRENTSNQLLLLALIAAFLIFFHWAIRPWSTLFSIYLSIGTSAVFFIAFSLGTDLFTNEPKEPLSFSDGVSLWPPLFIQIAASLMAVTFFIQSICELERNFCRLNRRYFDTRQFPAPQFPTPQFLFCLNYDEPDECEPWLSRRLRSLRPWLGLSVIHWVASVVLFVVLIGTIITYAWNDVYPSELPFWWCFPILAVVAILYLMIIGHRDHISIKHWMEATPVQINLGSDLWQQYYDHGWFGPRIVRVVWIWLIFAIIETVLVYLLPPWPLPWRGATDPASRFDMAPWTGVLSFTMIMLLLFFILDAVRLNFYWIKKLRTQHPLLNVQPPGPFVRPARRSRLASLEDMVSQVAERTRAVDKLIYYPMLCIMLMLFSKITYFDNQEFPLSKGITFGAAISLLFLSGFVLRREANELKLSVIKSVRDMHVHNNDREIDETIRRIDAIDEGAFQSMFEQPVMQALLIILASIGLFAGEYLKVFG